MEPEQDMVIERYRTILAQGERMHQSAVDEAWEDLIAQASDYVSAIEDLERLEYGAQLDAARREIKLDLLNRIRDNEQQVSEMLQARMSQLGELMAQSRTELRVHQAYESGMPD